jgi:phosphatidylserine/phosphatidylglycerophosphate/cardiolipin synthase-like enzyme
MHDNELHAKTIEIDGHYATIGSDNLDHISWAYNAEAKVLFFSCLIVCINLKVEIYDQSVAQKLRENFRLCVSAGREIDLQYMNSRGALLKFISLIAYKGYHMIYPWKRTSHLE